MHCHYRCRSAYSGELWLWCAPYQFVIASVPLKMASTLCECVFIYFYQKPFRLTFYENLRGLYACCRWQICASLYVCAQYASNGGIRWTNIGISCCSLSVFCFLLWTSSQCSGSTFSIPKLRACFPSLLSAPFSHGFVPCFRCTDTQDKLWQRLNIKRSPVINDQLIRIYGVHHAVHCVDILRSVCRRKRCHFFCSMRNNVVQLPLRRFRCARSHHKRILIVRGTVSIIRAKIRNNHETSSLTARIHYLCLHSLRSDVSWNRSCVNDVLTTGALGHRYARLGDRVFRAWPGIDSHLFALVTIVNHWSIKLSIQHAHS